MRNCKNLANICKIIVRLRKMVSFMCLLSPPPTSPASYPGLCAGDLAGQAYGPKRPIQLSE
jgi:hypothetical protein